MTATTIRVQMAQRKDTAANWTAANPILLSGEIGYETDTEKFKIGDGTTNWNGLDYLPIPDGSGNLTITGNLEIGTTGTLTFEGSTANDFETTLAVTDPTADRTITLPDVSGTVVTTGDTGTVTSAMLADGTIVDADVSATAEIAVSKLANGTANQVLVTDGTDVSWSDDLTLAGNLTVNGTTTTVNTETLVVEDKNIELGVVATPTDLTADGGGITLKGTTDKTINWVDSTDAWTLSEHVDLGSGKEYRIAGTKVLDGTSLGSAVVSSSLTSVGTIGSGTWQGTTIGAGYGGTGQTTYTDGQLLIGKTDGTLAKATITQGSGVTITNGDGSITISATGSGGTVTAVTGTSPIASTGGTTPDISIQDGTTTQKGAVQLEDSTSSTSTTTAATPNSVKSAYDLANAALPKSGGTMTGDIVFSGTQTFPGTGSGTVTSIDVSGGTGLTSSGGPITSSGIITVDLDNTAVTPGSYTYASITVDQQGRLTAASNGTTPLTSSDIGVTVQGYDADTAKLDVAQTFTAAQTIAADLTLNAQSDLRFADSDSSNWVAFQAPATVASNVTWTLPNADGTSGQVLSTDGTGALSWTSSAGSGDKIEEGNTSVEVIDTGSDGRVVFTTEGNEVGRFDSSGRLGVGNTSPGTKLDILNGSDAAVIATINGADASSEYLGLGIAGGEAIITAGGNGSTSNALVFRTASSGTESERARIDSSGRLLVGTSSARSDISGANSPQFQIESVGTDAASSYRAALSIIKNGADVRPAYLILGKSRGASLGSDGLVSNGDILGEITFVGNDGSELEKGATVQAVVDGTPGANDLPTRLVFSTTADGASSPTERMRIENTGLTRLYANNNDVVHVALTSAAAGTTAAIYKGFHSSSGVLSGTQSYIVWSNGNVVNTNNSYGALSDIKLKENIVAATSQWNDIKALQVRKYNFKEGQTHTQIGLVAQEVELVSPGLVSESPDRDEDGNDLGTVTKSVNYSVLYMKAVKALQEAMERIETLEAKVAALEAA